MEALESIGHTFSECRGYIKAPSSLLDKYQFFNNENPWKGFNFFLTIQFMTE